MSNARGLPSPTTALVWRAQRLRDRGQARKAIALLTAGLNGCSEPDEEVTLRLKRAECHSDLADWRQLERDARCALPLGGRRAVALLARSLLEMKRPHEAAAVLESHGTGAPPDSEWWVLSAQALSADNRHDEAVTAMQRAYGLDPTLAAEFSDVLVAARRHDGNIEIARRVLGLAGGARSPHALGVDQEARLWANLGSSLSACGDSEQSVHAFREALHLDPKLSGARWALGFSLLRLGRFQEGFQCYEHRQKAAGICRRMGVRPWQGESLAGKHLVVAIEQGFGDTVQFVRFLPEVHRRAARTTLITSSKYERVLASNPAFGEIRSGHRGFGFGDYQTLLMSLPHHLGATADLEKYLGPCPYLYPESAVGAAWRARLPSSPKIALVWQGNPSYAGDRWRSMPWRFYEPLVHRFGTSAAFLSLQKHFGRDQLLGSPVRQLVLDLGDQIDNGADAFVDSLAILAEVDLLITTDTGLAHLAGAAGVRTWLLLGSVADWRWGIGSDRSVWYPTIRMFRQPVPGDWPGVIDQVIDALERSPIWSTGCAVSQEIPPPPRLPAGCQSSGPQSPCGGLAGREPERRGPGG